VEAGGVEWYIDAEAEIFRDSREPIMKRGLRLSLLIVVVLIHADRIAFADGATAVADDKRFEVPKTDAGLPGAGPIRRGDWFLPVWKERRMLFDSHREEDQGAVVFLGDSITQGWGDDFHGIFGSMKAANRGISGDTTRGMLVRLDEDVLALDPSAVVMLMGTNDLDDGATPKVIAGNVRLIIGALHKHDADMPILLCLVMPSSPEKNRPVEKIREVNRLYREIAKDYPDQVTVIDTWTVFANDEGNAKPEEFPDLLHPNVAGYSKWAAALEPPLEAMGFLELTPP
jgi:lysophospholipase L1-like esterase